MTSIVPLLAGASALAVIGVLLATSPAGRLRTTLGAALGAFAAESVLRFVLLVHTEQPAERLEWLDLVRAGGLLVVVAWILFVTILMSPTGRTLPRAWRVGTAGVAVLSLLAIVAVLSGRSFVVADVPGDFLAARLDVAGRFAVVAELLGTAAVLAGLEMALRTSERASRWRIKYLILGAGGVFLARFYFLSQELLFDVLLASYLTTQAATLVVGNLLVAASLVRERLVGTELRVSRHVLYRSVVVGMLGLYLFVAGALGWVLNALSIAEELFWGSFVVFVAAVGSAVLLLSENLRWRVKRFIGRHFYESKYDYRQQWMTFTRRLGSLVTRDELAPQLIAAVADAVGTARAVLYLPDGNDDAHLHPAAAVEVSRTLMPLPAGLPLLRRVRETMGPVVLDAAEVSQLLPSPLPAVFPASVIAVPLFWRESLTGLMLVGPERTGRPYALEDADFLATVAQQAAAALVAARFSETLAQAREFEAFHRLSSFVIHDLKNSISALSLLSENALANFDDPEFQRDAIRTLSRTVDRQKTLLARLASGPTASTLTFTPVDVAALVDEATSAVKRTARIRIVKELAALPPVVGDAEALLQVLQNLVTNAVEALDGNGTLAVRAYQETDRVVLEVADSGCGMPDEFLRKSLFTPFRSTKKGGWGIGLYQAKGIVEGHGGTIEASSRQGEGTTFRVKLPAAASAGEAASR